MHALLNHKSALQIINVTSPLATEIVNKFVHFWYYSLQEDDWSWPSPGHAIDPSITHRGKDDTPHYSLSSRHKELVPFNTPGPGTYGPEKKATCFQG